jgi:hypothetical protein
MAAKYKKNLIPISGTEIAVYASPNVSVAFTAVVEDMNLFKGAKLGLILEAVYTQGKKDGAREAFSTVAGKFSEAQALIPHKNPGKPKKKKTA